jgi:hypothetical protein
MDPVAELAAVFDGAGAGGAAAAGEGVDGAAGAASTGAALGACSLGDELFGVVLLCDGELGVSAVRRDCLPIFGAGSASAGGGSPTLCSTRLDSRDMYELRGQSRLGRNGFRS